MDDWTARNEEENRNPKHSNNCNWTLCKGWLNDKPCSYIPKNTSKPNAFDNAMTAGLKQIAKNRESLPPWNPEPTNELSAIPALKDEIIDLPTSEQQQLYEWMHNALGLRIR